MARAAPGAFTATVRSSAPFSSAARDPWARAGFRRARRRDRGGGGAGGGGVRGAAGNAVRAMLSRREARRAQLPRLVDGFCLLRLPPPHERRRHELAPAPARAVVARGGGGGRELTRASALR